MSNLDSLNSVALRAIWPGEATHFTQWLQQKEHLALLGRALGMTLEPIEPEQSIGKFRLDILAKDEQQRLVAIENQFGETDHKHLGQLITYAAGVAGENTKPVTAIWIAETFCDEHRKCLDLLNSAGSAKVRFFAVEVSLWSIGNSKPAPMFSVVSAPPASVRALPLYASQMRKDRNLLWRFWTAFIEYANQQKAVLHFKHPTSNPWLTVHIARTDYRVAFTAWDSGIGYEIAYAGPDPIDAQNVLKLHLNDYKEPSGDELIVGDTAKRFVKASCERDANLADEEQWQEYFEWLLPRGEQLYNFMLPRLTKGHS